jgi:hypothetical protein
MAFTLDALASATNPARYLDGDQNATARSLRAMRLALGVAEPARSPA